MESITRKKMKERFVAAVPAILLSFLPQSLNVSMACMIKFSCQIILSEALTIH